MGKLAALKAVPVDPYRFGQWMLPDNYPHVVDILVDSRLKKLTAWIVTTKKSGVSRAMIVPEGLPGKQNFSLLNDGIFVGIYPNRQAAAQRLADLTRWIEF